MAISTDASYLPTMQAFMDHWTVVNTALSPGLLTLKGGYTLANFTSDRAAIQASITAIEPVDNARQFASADRDIKKAALRIRLAQYRAFVNGQLPGTPYVNTLPVLPGFSVGSGLFLKPFDDMANEWAAINAATIAGFTPPMLLAGGYTLATFNTDLAALRAAFIATTIAEDNARRARSERDILLAPAKARMLQYRQSVKAMLPAGSAPLNTIPAVTPPPGSTPDPVNVGAVWNPATMKADLTWTASPNPNLAHYSVRTAPGPKYKAAEESTIAEVAKTLTTYSTDAGLPATGSKALFRVYVVLTTTNARGSNTVAVTRP